MRPITVATDGTCPPPPPNHQDALLYARERRCTTAAAVRLPIETSVSFCTHIFQLCPVTNQLKSAPEIALIVVVLEAPKVYFSFSRGTFRVDVGVCFLSRWTRDGARLLIIEKGTITVVVS